MSILRKLPVVGKYFDAMFHIANWGTKLPLLRFPKELLDREAIQLQP